MKKKIIIIITIIITVIFLTIGGIFIYNKWRIANAKIIVELNDNLKIDVFQDIKLSDIIKSINDKLKDNYRINNRSSSTGNLLIKIIICSKRIQR